MLAQGFRNKDKVLPLKVVSTQEALAVACAAYRIRKGYQKHTQRFSEDKPTQHSNKEIFYYRDVAGQGITEYGEAIEI